MPPGLGGLAAPLTIQITPPALGIDHMSGNGLNVAELTALGAYEIAIAHKCHLIALNPDDAVYHISVSVHPCQHHVADISRSWRLKDHTFLATDDKW